MALVTKGALEDSLSGSVTVKTSTYGEYISVTAPVSFLSSLLDTPFHQFTREVGDLKDASYLIRTPDSYSLPESVHADVHTVFNTVQLPPPAHARPADNINGGTRVTTIKADGTMQFATEEEGARTYTICMI